MSEGLHFQRQSVPCNPCLGIEYRLDFSKFHLRVMLTMCLTMRLRLWMSTIWMIFPQIGERFIITFSAALTSLARFTDTFTGHMITYLFIWVTAITAPSTLRSECTLRTRLWAWFTWWGNYIYWRRMTNKHSWEYTQHNVLQNSLKLSKIENKRAFSGSSIAIRFFTETSQCCCPLLKKG